VKPGALSSRDYARRRWSLEPVAPVGSATPAGAR
jgi:hypothetical protein